MGQEKGEGDRRTGRGRTRGGRRRTFLEVDIDRRGKGPILDVHGEEVKLIVFTLHGDYFAFYGTDIKEILALRKINYVPGCPDYILGITNVRDDVELVIDINGFLEFPARSETKQVSEPHGSSRRNLYLYFSISWLDRSS